MSNNGLLGYPGPRLRSVGARPVPYLFDPTRYGTTTFWGRADRVSGAGVDTTKQAAQQCLSWDNLTGGTAVSTTAASSTSPVWIPVAWSGLPGLVFSGRGMQANISTATGAAVRSMLAIGFFPQTPMSAGTTNRIVMQGDTTTTVNMAYGFGFTSSTYRTIYYGGNTNSTNGNSAVTPSQTTPDVIIGTYDGTTSKLYVNGSQVVSEAVTLGNTTDTLTIGSATNGVTTNALTGILLEVAVWSANVTASAAEITALLQSQWRIS